MNSETNIETLPFIEYCKLDNNNQYSLASETIDSRTGVEYIDK